ncbi:toll/interleukin-1 receptor domain-containing protein [Streptomyces sp. NPDC002763]|uniref:toll/interleukin-1 receptor domain-containing protein n=1 Tax=Streptomyces sp. NPDC002763 TaxID=3154427 RepID=UPI00332D9B1D
MRAFISHNHRDKPAVKPLAARLRLLGVDVWLDSWEIRPGDSIPGKVDQALSVVDTVMVFWSQNASKSRWVNTEWETALTRSLDDDSVRVIPVLLDETPLPTLLRRIMWVSMTDDDVDRVARELVGIESQADLVKTMQQTVEESGLEYQYFHGYGVAVGCLKCGAPSSKLEGWSVVDDSRDDLYAGVRCTQCGWNEGGEIFW